MIYTLLLGAYEVLRASFGHLYRDNWLFHHEKSSNLLFEYSITGGLDRCDTPCYWALTYNWRTGGLIYTSLLGAYDRKKFQSQSRLWNLFQYTRLLDAYERSEHVQLSFYHKIFIYKPFYFRKRANESLPQ